MKARIRRIALLAGIVAALAAAIGQGSTPLAATHGAKWAGAKWNKVESSQYAAVTTQVRINGAKWG